MFETFAHRLAAGLALALFALPPGEMAPRFVRIQFVIILGVGVGGAILGWETPHPDAYWLALGIGLGAALVGPLCWSPPGLAAGYACVTAAAGGLLLAAALAPAGEVSLGGALTTLFSATLLGLAMTAMLMGHWYLIAPTMSIRPLLTLLTGLLVACGLRGALAAWELATAAPWLSTFDGLTWLWLATRWGAGLVGVAVLTWMAREAARIRSTQSATGILYVVTILAFMGELTDVLLKQSLTRSVA